MKAFNGKAGNRVTAVAIGVRLEIRAEHPLTGLLGITRPYSSDHAGVAARPLH